MLALAGIRTERVPFPFTLIECVIDESSILVCQPNEPYAGVEGKRQSITPSFARSIDASFAGSAKEPLNASISTIPPGEIVTFGVRYVRISPKSRIELTIIVDTL